MQEILAYPLLVLGSFQLTVGSLLSALLIYVVTKVLLLVTIRLFRRFARRRNMDKGRHHSFVLLIRYFAWVVAVSFMIKALGIDITFLVASSAALLVGLGLGLQHVFADVVSGIFLLFEGTIEVGDVLEVDGTVGRIEEIGLRTSIFRNRDDMIMVIPNHKFIQEKVINWNYNNSVTRFIITIPVAYQSDMSKVRQVLLDCAKAHKHVITDRDEYPPSVRMAEFQERGVLFELLFYSENMFRIESTKSDIRLLIWEAFQQEGIQVPVSQLELRVKKQQQV
jgi:small-conductance mechanosensitive channel